jgi:predicted Zn-dependent protease
MLNKAGIRSDGLISFFRRLQKSGEDVPGGLSFLSTHPIHEDRISAVRSSARKGGAAMSPREWRAVREICGGNA